MDIAQQSRGPPPGRPRACTSALRLCRAHYSGRAWRGSRRDWLVETVSQDLGFPICMSGPWAMASCGLRWSERWAGLSAISAPTSRPGTGELCRLGLSLPEGGLWSPDVAIPALCSQPPCPAALPPLRPPPPIEALLFYRVVPLLPWTPGQKGVVPWLYPSEGGTWASEWGDWPAPPPPPCTPRHLMNYSS